jgi:hypothetical protein
VVLLLHENNGLVTTVVLPLIIALKFTNGFPDVSTPPLPISVKAGLVVDSSPIISGVNLPFVVVPLTILRRLVVSSLTPNLATSSAIPILAVATTSNFVEGVLVPIPTFPPLLNILEELRTQEEPFQNVVLPDTEPGDKKPLVPPLPDVPEVPPLPDVPEVPPLPEVPFTPDVPFYT